MAKVNPIPDGFHTLTPHLVVPDVGAAMKLYAKAFGAQERFSLPGPDGKIAHAMLAIGDSAFMLGQECVEQGSRAPATLGGSPVVLHLYLPDVDAAFTRATGAGCTTAMPPTDMFWGDRYGVVTDPFGHSWAIATHTRDVTPAEMEAAMRSMGAHAGG